MVLEVAESEPLAAGARHRRREGPLHSSPFQGAPASRGSLVKIANVTRTRRRRPTIVVIVVTMTIIVLILLILIINIIIMIVIVIVRTRIAELL